MVGHALMTLAVLQNILFLAIPGFVLVFFAFPGFVSHVCCQYGSKFSMAPGSPEIGTSECDDGVDPTPQDACAKAPDHFGAGEGGEVVQYTEYIDNAKKTKTLQSGFEPQMNGDVGPGPAVASREGQERPSSVANATAYPKANQAVVQSKVPKFGAWEGGDENYTVYFDRARDSKHSGKKINPNDPEENPDMFRPIKDSAQTQTRGAKRKSRGSKVPDFGAWEDGDSSGTPRNYGRAPWINDLFVDSRQHQPSIHEDAYGGGNRTTYDQIPLGNESQANVAATPRNLPEQKPTKQKKGRRFYWFRRRSGRERNAVP